VLEWLAAVLEWLAPTTNPPNVHLTAARWGEMAVLEWSRIRMLRYEPHRSDAWGNGVMYYAALGAHVNVIRWARAQGFCWSATAPLGAAHGGNLDLLRWLANQDGCWMDHAHLLNGAAAWNQLKVLEWLVEERRATLHPEASRHAARHGSVEAVEWLRERGCYDDDVCRISARTYPRLLEWMRSNNL